jgi:hypothetical protein
MEKKMSNDIKDIKEQLDIIISLMIPPFSKGDYETKEGTQTDVLKLCDLRYTQQEMATKLKKTKKSVSKAIEKLNSKNLIKSVKKNDRVVYLRLK